MTAKHLPGTDNISADRPSRNFQTSGEWDLNHNIFVRFCSHFSARYRSVCKQIQYKIQKNCFLVFRSICFGYRRLFINWNGYLPYIFCPFSLIGQMLSKVKDDRVKKAIIVVPL